MEIKPDKLQGKSLQIIEEGTQYSTQSTPEAVMDQLRDSGVEVSAFTKNGTDTILIGSTCLSQRRWSSVNFGV